MSDVHNPLSQMKKFLFVFEKISNSNPLILPMNFCKSTLALTVALTDSHKIIINVFHKTITNKH